MANTHNRPEQGEPGPFRQDVDSFVELGLLECRLEANPARREGSEDGLRVCAMLRDATVEDFEGVLVTMQQVSDDKRGELGAKEASHEDCLRQTSAAVMVGQCFEMLRVAHRIRYDDFYGDPFTISDGRARPNPSCGISEQGITKFTEISGAATNVI